MAPRAGGRDAARPTNRSLSASANDCKQDYPPGPHRRLLKCALPRFATRLIPWGDRGYASLV